MTAKPNPIERLLGVQIPIQPRDDVLAWLKGKSAEELGAIEAHEVCTVCFGGKVKAGTAQSCAACDGTGRALVPRVFFPESLRFRGARGQVIEEPVYFVIPREPEFLKAQDEAVQYFRDRYDDASIKTVEQAQERVGQVRYLSVENSAIVSLCARSREPPHIRAYKLHVLIDRFDPTVIADAFNRIDMIRRCWDVRVSELTPDQIWGMCQAIAEAKNVSPLVVLDDALVPPFVQSLAVQLKAFRTCSSCSGCKHTSTPETSP